MQQPTISEAKNQTRLNKIIPLSLCMFGALAGKKQGCELATPTATQPTDAPEKIGKSVRDLAPQEKRVIGNTIWGRRNKLALNLNDKGLTSLDGLDEIRGIKEVRTLNLSGNDLGMVSEHAFDKFPNLKTLLLTNNELVVLPQNLFRKQKRLTWLGLSGNNLTNLPQGILNRQQELSTLLLARNKLRDLPEGILHPLENLTALDVSGNKLPPEQVERLKDYCQEKGVSLNVSDQECNCIQTAQ